VGRPGGQSARQSTAVEYLQSHLQTRSRPLPYLDDVRSVRCRGIRAGMVLSGTARSQEVHGGIVVGWEHRQRYANAWGSTKVYGRRGQWHGLGELGAAGRGCGWWVLGKACWLAGSMQLAGRQHAVGWQAVGSRQQAASSPHHLFGGSSKVPRASTHKKTASQNRSAPCLST